MTLKMLTELQRCRVAFVEATSEALTYLRAAAMQPSESRKRTCESLKTCADAKGIYTDKRRRTVYTLVDDPDGGRQRRVARKVLEWDQIGVNASATALATERDAGFPHGFGPGEADTQAVQEESEAEGNDVHHAQEAEEEDADHAQDAEERRGRRARRHWCGPLL